MTSKPEAPQFAVQFRVGTNLSVFGTAANNPFRFRGKGSAQVKGLELVLEGPRSRPFWFSKKTQVAVPLGLIRDVRHKGKMVSFDLPGKLAASSKGTPVALAMLAINIAVFAAFAYSGGGFSKADSEMLIRWGSNFGPLTTDGQWWRLLSAAFLHGGLVHLLVNLYTLYDFGRMSERVFGSAAFLAIYLLSALLGSAASVWWNPSVNSVGASGALFGVLGASLVYMLDKRNGVPPSVMTTHATWAASPAA